MLIKQPKASCDWMVAHEQVEDGGFPLAVAKVYSGPKASTTFKVFIFLFFLKECFVFQIGFFFLMYLS